MNLPCSHPPPPQIPVSIKNKGVGEDGAGEGGA